VAIGQVTKAFLERMQAFALKAGAEGKQETSGLNPNPPMSGIADVHRTHPGSPASAEFLNSLETLAQRVARLGALNSLSQIT